MIADDLTLAAMVRLQHDKDFRIILDYLTTCKNEQIAYCMQERDEVLLRRAQGAASEISEFIMLCDNARSIVEQRQVNIVTQCGSLINDYRY